MIAGALELQMTADIARLKSDMAAVKNEVFSATSSIEKNLVALKSTFGSIGAALGIGFGLHAFESFIDGAIKAEAQLHKLSLQTGITVETLSALRPIAKQAGTDLDTVAGMVNKLEKNMITFAQSGGGKAADAFKQLGYSQAQVKAGLQDMDKFLPSFAKKLVETGVGGEQAGLAMQLMAKGGAAALPFLDQLAKAGELHARVTALQAEEAHKLEIEITKLKDGANLLAISLANALVPKMNDVIEFSIRIKDEWGKIASILFGLGGGSILAALGVEINRVARATNDAADAFTKLMAAKNKLVAEKTSTTQLGIMTDNPLGRWLKSWAVGKAQVDVDAATKNLNAAIKLANDENAAAAAKSAAAKPPPNNPLGPAGESAAKIAAELKLYENALQSLEQQLGKLNHQTEYEKTLYQELHGSLQKLTPTHKAYLLEIAKQIDEQKFLTETTEAYWKALDELDATEQKRIEHARQIIEGMQDSNDKIAFENSLIGMSADERERLNVEYERAIKLKGVDSQLQIDGINKQFDELAALVKTRQEMNQQISTWTELSKGAGNFFGDLVVNGKSAFDRLRASLKSFAQELIALFAQKWILNVAAGALGSTALGSAAASAGAGTMAGSVLGAGIGTAGAGLASLGYANAVGLAGGDAMGALIAANASGWGVTSATSILGAIPGVGWAAMAAVAVAAILGKDGGPKVEITDGALIAGVGSTYAQYAAALGGKPGAFSGSSFIGKDPEGTALTQLQLAASINGKSVYDRRASGRYEDVGRSDAELQAAIEQATREALLAALKATEFDGVTQAFIDAIHPTVEGFKALTDYMTAVAGRKELLDSLMTDTERLTSAQEALATAGLPSTLAGFQTLARGLDLTTQAGRDTLTSMIGLKGALDTVTHTADALLTAQGQVRAALRDISNQVYAFGQRVIDTAKGVQTARDAISSAYWAAQDNVNNLLRQAADNLSRFATTIDDFLATLMPTQSIGSLKAQLSATAALAAGGDADSQAKLINIAKAVIKASEGSSSSAIENARNVAFVRSTLEGVKSALIPEQSAAAAAAEDFATQLATAKRAVVDLGLIAEATGAATERSGIITLDGADLLDAYNTAVADSTTAQQDYAVAVALTTGLNLSAAGSMDTLIGSLHALGDANDALTAAGGSAADKLGTTRTEAEKLATQLGLSGDAAKSFVDLLANPSTGVGQSLSDFIDYVNGLIGTITIPASVPTPTSVPGGTAGGATGGTTIDPASLVDRWVGDTFRASTGATLDRAAGTFSGTAGASGTIASLQAAMADIGTAVASGSVGEQQAAMNIIAAMKAQGGNAATLDAIMGWAPGTSNAGAQSLGLPAFANGGVASGWAMVGEQGPELAHFGSPARIYPAGQSRAMVAANDDIVLELRELRSEVAALRVEAEKTSANTGSTAKSTSDTELIMEQVVFGQETVRTKAIA